MIGKLKGRVDEISEDSVIIDVGGVGYQAFCSTRTLADLKVGEAAQLIIETHVREDHIHLYGFENVVERDWFRLLVTVQRVGNKMALTILGIYTPEQIAHAIMAKDTAAFSRISGVGPKLAERIVTELKDKVMKLPTSEFKISGTESAKKTPSTKHQAPSTSSEDAISALVNLGYSRTEAYTAVSKHPSEKLDQLIKLSLKELMRA